MKRPPHVGAVTVNILKKRTQTTDKWRYSILGVGHGFFQFFTVKKQRIANFFTLDLYIWDCCVHGNEIYVSINDGMFRAVDRLVAPQ